MNNASSYHPTTELLKDRVILVTGAGSGLGQAAALTYAKHGAQVILLGKTVAKLEACYDAIASATSKEPAIYPLDLRGATPDDYEKLAKTIQENYGRLDGLLHSAGVLGKLTPIEHYPALDWFEVMQVNLHSAFLLTQACLPLLKQASDASIIFISSGVAKEPRAYWGAYAVSKSAMESLVRVLADELTHTGVRCNAINPGPVRTAMRAKAFPAEDPQTLPAPQDMMADYLYFMGPESKGMTGQVVKARCAKATTL